jgi:DNA (cytosine-5)-methyltransferase 1
VDTTKAITHIGLCAGYGGIELGLKRVLPTLRTVALCEIEAFAVANLVAKMEAGLMDPAPVWTDLKTFPWEPFRDRVDILTGGYPCQPFSAAGKRLGTDDPRHLWPSISAGIAIIRPRICFFENVEGHISLGLREVIADLERLGYEATWGIFSAAECGAPHQRKRVFILAHRKGEGLEGYSRLLAGCDKSRRELQESQGQTNGCSDGGEIMADPGHEQFQGRDNTSQRQQLGARGISWGELTSCHDQIWPARPGQPQHAWEPPRILKPPLGGDADGTADRLDDAIVWAADCEPCPCCDDVICWKCGGHYADCPCPGPHSNDN